MADLERNIEAIEDGMLRARDFGRRFNVLRENASYLERMTAPWRITIDPLREALWKDERESRQ